MSQRTVTSCDACKRDDLKPGYVVISVSGDRSSLTKDRFESGRNSIDICDECALLLGAWVAGRQAENNEIVPEDARLTSPATAVPKGVAAVDGVWPSAGGTGLSAEAVAVEPTTTHPGE